MVGNSHPEYSGQEENIVKSRHMPELKLSGNQIPGMPVLYMHTLSIAFSYACFFSGVFYAYA